MYVYNIFLLQISENAVFEQQHFDQKYKHLETVQICSSFSCIIDLEKLPHQTPWFEKQGMACQPAKQTDHDRAHGFSLDSKVSVVECEQSMEQSD